jgi:putative glutamine amidotransferase
MRRPLVGLTVANRQDRHGPAALSVHRAYVDGLRQAGADVVLLAPGRPPSPALADRLDGIVLPGGVDVDPARYGERPRPQLGAVDPELDDLELSLVRMARERELPLFGICRGQQVVNVALGGTLYQDLAADGGTTLPHRCRPEDGGAFLTHAIEILPRSRLHRVVGAGRLEVNSFHHQAVRDVAPGLQVTATSPADGVIEGLETPDGLVLTVQCHPEELIADHAWARALFSDFVVTAADLSRSLARS